MIENSQDILPNKTENLKPSQKGLFGKIVSSETLTIATIPILCYLIVFIYDWGYLNFYSIPLNFIYFDINQIFIVFVFISILALVLFIFGDMLFSVFRTVKPPIRRKLNTYIPNLLLCFIYFIIYGKLVKYWLSFLAILAALILIENVIIILRFRKKKSLEKIYQAYYDEKDYKNKNETFITSYDKIFRFLGPHLSVFIFCLYIVYQIGNAKAMTKNNYYVVNTTPERVMVWSTDKIDICSSFNRDKNTINKNYIILNRDDNSLIEYTLENIGPFTVIEQDSQTSHSCQKCDKDNVYHFNK